MFFKNSFMYAVKRYAKRRGLFTNYVDKQEGGVNSNIQLYHQASILLIWEKLFASGTLVLVDWLNKTWSEARSAPRHYAKAVSQNTG